MAFAENLCYLRKRAGITQEELADELNVSRQSVSKWETGEAYPETEKIIALCNRFGVSMDVLMRGDVKAEEETVAARDGDLPGGAAADVPQTASPPLGGGRTSDENVRKIKKAVIDGTAAVVFVIVYLLFGVLEDLWHPMWVLCFIVPFCSCITEIFFGGGSLRKRIQKGVDGAVIFACVAAYLVFGFFFGWWHPTWLVFLLIPVTCAVTAPLCAEEEEKE